MRKHLIFIAVIALVAIFAFGALGTAYAAGTYTVQPGDSLFSIAARFNVSISQLATINKVYDVNTLSVGQVLLLPDPIPGASGQSPVVITSNSAITGTTANATSYTTGIYTPPVVTYPGGTTVTTVTSYTSYVVRAGDFLASIANRYSTTPDAILSANAIANPNLLYVGQLLTIPRIRTNVSPAPVVRVVPAYNIRSGRVYIVQPGDILFGIAARFGRNVYSIAQANGILDLNAIYVGEPLIIP